ncbi:TrmJ/YjtD family RNA methyltransferase [Candidatus Woesearchaeota archaeon]|nr:TrmJ/YjtD family RNA methyltransferase [Candidatus Woesearchaeota archaeon]
MVTIILHGIEHPGNLGAVCRSMKNFGFKDIVLVNPVCKPSDQEARNRAKHAQDILKKAKLMSAGALKEYDCVIGTTALVGTDYNIPRSPLTPEHLASMRLPKKTAIMFGPESSGLTNAQLRECDFVVTIPSTKKYPTLNLSQAVTIILYELSKGSRTRKVHEHIQFASAVDKTVLLKMIFKRLDAMEFATPEKKQTQKIVWKKMIGKSMLTKREAFALFGFFRKLR